MKCGDICLVQYPFTDGSSSKLRPVLIVSNDEFNSGQDVVVVPISSVVQPDSFSVLIDPTSRHWKSTGLKYPSSIKCTKPLTIAKRLCLRRLGHLHDDVMKDVRAILRRIIA
jgi:mRNA interferase MazF